MLKSLLNLFFPKFCSGCNAFLLQNELVICTSCRHEIPITNHLLNHENELFKKFYGRLPLEFACALFYFHKKGITQELIHNLKYRGHQEIGTILGVWFANDLRNFEKIADIDEIIPIPLHKKRLKQRGYNQVTTFGVALSNELKIKYNPNILVRNLHLETQSKKNLLDRSALKNEVFDVVFSEENHNKHYLLIDDVITTGSTLELSAKQLLKIPGAKISICCMAMAQG